MQDRFERLENNIAYTVSNLIEERRIFRFI